MTVVPCAQVRVVGNHPPIIKIDQTLAAASIHFLRHKAPSVSPAIGRIAITIDACLVAEALWKALAAFAVLHARGVLGERATGPMNHALGHRVVQIGMQLGVRDLSGYDSIEVRGTSRLSVIRHDEENVSMREPSFLKLDHEKVGDCLTKHVTILDVADERLELHTEHSRHNVWAVLGLLPLEEIALYLVPFRVARHSDEHVWFTMGSNNCHSIVVHPKHVSLASCVRRG